MMKIRNRFVRLWTSFFLFYGILTLIGKLAVKYALIFKNPMDSLALGVIISLVISFIWIYSIKENDEKNIS